MIWKVKDINKEQVITVVLLLPHFLPCNQVENLYIFKILPQRDLFLTLDSFIL